MNQINILEYIKSNILYLDGGFGTSLQNAGLEPGELPENWNITHSDAVIEIHKAYFDSGSNVVSTNTFGANTLKFNAQELEKVVDSAILNAKKARDLSIGKQNKYIALDIGPTGRLLKPYGDLDFEQAVEIFADTIKIGACKGVDLIIIETMNDCYETKAALLAAKENCNLPVFVMNAYGEDGKLMSGTPPKAMVAMLEGMGADAIGFNCSLGPKALFRVAKELLEYSSVPVIAKPNAGLPKSVDSKTVYDVLPDEFSSDIATFVKDGIRIVGGCCGTTPEYIKEIIKKTKGMHVIPCTAKNKCIISSGSMAVEFKDSPILIGERINPTGKKRFKQALKENDISYILNEGINQQEKNVHVLDVNVGLPEIDEAAMLVNVVKELQSVVDVPLQIDTSNIKAMEDALRIYNGKAMINSVNGKKEIMEQVFPLAKKYGGLIVSLTLDENGIPNTAEGRLAIAKNILSVAKSYGIDSNNIIFDTLAMTVSADSRAAIETLKSVKLIKDELNCKVSLGVSNVSFGLPNRDVINSTFFACALENGLSAAIMNPYSSEMMRTYYSFRALHNMDENCLDYIENAKTFSVLPSANLGVTNGSTNENHNSTNNKCVESLSIAVEKGLKERAQVLTTALVDSGRNPLDLVQDEIIPALNEVGKGFEAKTLYLPQLLMSAEAAKSAFEVIKSRISSNKNQVPFKCNVVIATVKGDIHDIGKNIVKLLLENYGFMVYDLGKDVSPRKIVDEAKKVNAPIICLSALMTTTVPAMEDTIKLAHSELPSCKVMVGGAVLNEEYANKIGADGYSKDAMGAVRFAEELLNNIKKEKDEK